MPRGLGQLHAEHFGERIVGVEHGLLDERLHRQRIDAGDLVPRGRHRLRLPLDRDAELAQLRSEQLRRRERRSPAANAADLAFVAPERGDLGDLTPVSIRPGTGPARALEIRGVVAELEAREALPLEFLSGARGELTEGWRVRVRAGLDGLSGQERVSAADEHDRRFVGCDDLGLESFLPLEGVHHGNRRECLGV